MRTTEATTRGTTTMRTTTMAATTQRVVARATSTYSPQEMRTQSCENKKSSETNSDCSCSNECFSCEWSFAQKDGECTKCQNEKYLHDGKCYDECPSGLEAIGRGYFGRICRASKTSSGSRRSAAEEDVGFNETERHGKGSGLGLYLVVGLVACSVFAVVGTAIARVNRKGSRSTTQQLPPTEVVVGEN
jgi:hypothetical protein